MNAVKLATKTDIAYRFIKKRILHGEYPPGHRLVLERIAREADTSQVPVREAMRRLEAEGYVVYEHNAGARVAELNAVEYDSIQYMIAVLEGAATANAAPHVSQDDLQRATALNGMMRRAREVFDAEGFIRLNAEFHDIICGPCPNRYLYEQLERERARMSLIRRPTLGKIMQLSHLFIDDHEKLVDIIRTDCRSPDIQLLAQSHKMRILQSVREIGSNPERTVESALTNAAV
jgi:DNA-binding GntR family transcriptional regulator